MRKVSLSPARGRGKRAELLLDGKRAFATATEKGNASEAPGSGQEQQVFRDCMNAAVRFITYRPRSEFEVRQRLQKEGCERAVIDAALEELKRRSLVNDADFAAAWMEDRNTFNPRSRKLIKLELRQKGIAGEVADQAVSGMDDSEIAYRAAKKKARGLSVSQHENFRKKLVEFLKRRGFDYGVINIVVDRVWQEAVSENFSARSPDAGA